MTLNKIGHLCFLVLLGVTSGFSQSTKIERVYNVAEAKQGVAVDSNYFYVINNSSIVKYNQHDGKELIKWQDSTKQIKHLNSGIILDQKLYCTHSNYPESPMVSSIEVFDPNTLKPIENISLGIYLGSATWLDFYDNHWYVAFAHYRGRGESEGKTNSWTQLVKFTKEWQRIEGWIFPKDLIEKFGTRSNSGGVITKSGTILITGHDNKELYELRFPELGYTLEWTNTYDIPYEGQGIALDKITDLELVLYGIIRKESKVLKIRIIH
ncbi:hypothetical protein DFQ09_101489 [Winogradskyella pacifica]|uniref:Uncharacterized protein n=1 Tax=Winogradskyella pacifica TaxID=664642 RepID=A0A3D9N729_9FLAO|nr:hypothetical protein [Winogradskyella pacifica]REE27655.1 hypothetical protein DFQ09_101489 [Winogradskyella pacifica]